MKNERFLRIIRKSILAALVAVSVLSVSGHHVTAASAITESSEEFTISEGVLTAYTGTAESIEIPEGVTKINNRVFRNCTTLESVVFPSTLTEIGGYAFDNTGLKEIVLPEGLKKLGEYAFQNCGQLEKVSIPASVSEASYYGIFKNCPNLKTVTFGDGIAAIPANLFAESSLEMIEIPDTVLSIGTNAFRDCKSLDQVKFSEQLTLIENRAFYNCTLLETIDLPETLESIGTYGFRNTGIKELTLPEGLKTLKSNVFQNCAQLTSVYIPATLTEADYYGVFANCPNLKTVTFGDGIAAVPANLFAESSITGIELPDTVLSIGNHAFRACKLLESIQIPDGVTSIGNHAFDGCESLAEVELSEELETIGNYAFMDCTSLEEIEFPKKLKSIGSYGFKNTSLKEVELPEGLTTIESSAFENCGELESVYIPATLTTAGYYGIFKDCSKLTEVTFGEGITGIPANLFAESSITGIELPDTVLSIGNHAFREGKRLERIQIPDGVTNIGNYAFDGCESLAEVGLSEELETIGNYAFMDCTSLEEIEFPKKLKSIGTCGFKNTSLKEVKLPEGLTTVESSAFENCVELENVSIPTTLTTVGYYGIFKGCSKLTEVTFGEGITVIPTNLFAESSITRIEIPETVTTIGERVFRANKSLLAVNIGKNVVTMGKDIFSGADQAVIYCYSGSAAANYAVANDVAYELLDGHEHLFSEWEITKKASCSYDGKKYRACRCGAVDYEVIPKLGHEHTKFWTVDNDPTCTTHGESSRHCIRCSHRIDIQVKKSQGHVYGEWVVVKEPDYEQDGKQQKICSVCEKAVSENIPKLVIDWDELEGYGLAKVRVVDGITGEALKDANVAFVLSEEEIYTSVTNKEGYAQRLIPVGDYKIQAYKEGYTARTVTQIIEEGEQMLSDIAISSQSVVAGELTVKEMTLEEILAAGIDTSDPDNTHVYKYEIKLRFEEGYEQIEFPVITYKNGKGKCLGYGLNIPDGVGGSTGSAVAQDGNEIVFKLGDSKYRMCIVNECFYIVLHGESKWLKEMFAVDLIVANNSAVDDLLDCVASVRIPYGVSLAAMNGAEQEIEQELGTIEKGTTRTVSWFIRGDLEGDYQLSAYLRGKMSSYNDFFSYEYKTKEPFHVYAGSALHLNVIISDAAYFNQPYTIILELENVSDKTLYYVEHKLNDIAQYKVKEYTWLEDGKVVDYKEEWDQLAKTEFGDTAMVTKEEFMPGEKLVVMVQTTVLWESPLQKTKHNSKRVDNLLELSGLANIPEGKAVQMLMKLISYIDVRYYLTDTIVSTLEGSTTTIPTSFTVEHKPGIKIEDKIKEILGDAVKGETIKFLTGDDDVIQSAITIYEGLKEEHKIHSADANTKVQVWVENANGDKPVLAVEAGSGKVNENGVIEFSGTGDISVNALNSGDAYLVVQDDDGNVYRKFYTVKEAGPGVAQMFGEYAKLLENKDVIIEPEKEITDSYLEYMQKLNFCILDDQLQEMGEGQKIPTGSVIKDKDTGEEKLIVVNGDTDSNAYIDIFDGESILQFLNGSKVMTEAQQTAAETTGNETISIEDILGIYNYLMEDEDASAYSLRRSVGEQLVVSVEDLGLSGYEIKGLQVDIRNTSDDVIVTGIQSLADSADYNAAGHIEDELWRTLIYNFESDLELDNVFALSYTAEETNAVLPIRVLAVTDQGNVELNANVSLSGQVVAEEEVSRISGASRYETGYKVADALKEVLGVEKFEAVVIATGKNFADALAGSYLAVEKNAPIILTNGKEDNIATLHTYIRENVNEGGKVYILGGTGAVPESVEVIDGYEVVRLAGKSRYDTNLAILAEAGLSGDQIIVATGKSFADSLSASAAKLPILLVKPGEALSKEAKEIASSMKEFYIIGGTGAVSADIEAELGNYGKVIRVAGKTRYETSVAVADTFFKEVDSAVVASGKNFPDGLCGGPLAAAMDAPLILTADGKTEAAADYMKCNGLASGFVLGGTGALSDQTVLDVFGLENMENKTMK